MISSTLILIESMWDSFILFCQTVSIFILLQSRWKVVYAVQIQSRESLKLLTNAQYPHYFLAEAITGFIYAKFNFRWIVMVTMLMDHIVQWFTSQTVIYHRLRSSSLVSRCAVGTWSGKWTMVLIQKLPSQCWKRIHLITHSTSTTRMTVVRTHSIVLQRVASCKLCWALKTDIHSFWIHTTHHYRATNRGWIEPLLLQ